MHKGNLQKQIKEVNLQALSDEARVTVCGYFYAVDFVDDPSFKQHRVGKDRRCCCSLGADCPAVLAVTEYLKAGGARAPDPPPGFFPVAPALCPICGAETVYNSSLNSRRRGAGWECVKSGKHHYWETHTKIMSEQIAKNPWVFPPVIAADGTVLYPGLRRDEVITTDS